MRNIFERIDYPNNAAVIARMKERIGQSLGEEGWAEITRGFEAPDPAMDNGQLSAATFRLVRSFDERADRALAYTVFSGVCHALKREHLAWARQEFLKYENIDAFADAIRKEQNEILRGFLERGESFYGQPIDQGVFDFVMSLDDLFYGRRSGDTITATAIPFRVRDYLDATDPVRKRYSACHCPFARESILREGQTVSQTICFCSLGHTKIFWEAALDTLLEGDVLMSALGGDSTCRFAVHLPDEILAKYT
jgi:hypothetical protein